MKKLLFGIMAIVLCVGLIGGAFAYFTDTQASTNNVFSSGNIQLQMANSSGVFSHNNDVVIGGGTNMAPGHEVGPFTVYFKNTGTVSGVVTAVVSYNTNIPGGNAYAQKLVVSTVTADGQSTNVAPYWAEQIVNTQNWSWQQGIDNGYIVASNTAGLAYPYLPTIYGLQTVVLHFSLYLGPSTFTDAPLAPGTYHYETISLMLDPTAGNAFENNSMPIIVTGTITSN
jgi:predicted ribosomally synthesized peptide with SipW-like signal peptide